MSINIMSWNILSGGFKDYGSSEERPPRIQEIVKAINEIKPDVVCLIDTYRWTEVFTHEELIELFGYPYAHCVKLDDERLISKGHDNGITVFSQLKDTSIQTIRLDTRNAVQISIDHLEIFSVYLDDLSEDVRVKQVNALHKFVNPNTPTIIAGDLNTIDFDDLEQTNKNIKELSQKFPGPMKNIEQSLTEMKRAEVTKLLKDNEFIDLGKDMGNTVPAKLFPLPIENPILRIDYAFGSKQIKLQTFEVLTDDKFGKLSDHYPILVTVSNNTV